MDIDDNENETLEWGQTVDKEEMDDKKENKEEELDPFAAPIVPFTIIAGHHGGVISQMRKFLAHQ